MIDSYSYLHQLFEYAVENYSDNTAVITSDATYSYSELNTKVLEHLAILKQYQLSPYARVLFYCSKSIDCIAAFIACSKLQLVYVPVSTLNPLERLFQIQTQCQSSLIVCDRNYTLPVDLAHESIETNSFLHSDICYFFFKDKEPKISHTPCAFILFTSGSTGTPKGVCISHTAALHFILWAANTFEIQSNDRLISIAPFNFDLSVFDIYAGMAKGASLVLYKDEHIKNPLFIAEMISGKQISHLYATPTFYHTLCTFGKIHKHKYSKVKMILFAGEKMPIETLHSLQESFNNASFYNLYGPTETNVCTYYPISNNIYNNTIPIGIPCPYSTCYIVDKDQNIINEVGLEGELCVGGYSLFTEYENQKEETDKRFIYINNTALYKTGDWVKRNEYGQFEFIGRMDHMIKKNGFRIEPAEIENALLQNNRITQVCVVFNSAKNCLACFYTCNNDIPILHEQFLIALQKQLPSYMIPDKFIYLHTFPVTQSGKTDRNALSREL